MFDGGELNFRRLNLIESERFPRLDALGLCIYITFLRSRMRFEQLVAALCRANILSIGNRYDVSGVDSLNATASNT